MKTFRTLFTILMLILSANTFAENTVHKTAKKADSKYAETTFSQNFNIVVQDNEGGEMTSWKADIFSLVDGKPVASALPQKPIKALQTGNYLLLLHFEEDIPEMQGHKPFTFSITDNTTTIFTLTVGTSQAPEMERGVNRTGSDFVASDPRQGRDYVNFELPKDQPEQCLARCKKDRNCDAYSYGNLPEWKQARCWLIHGATATKKEAHFFSGRYPARNITIPGRNHNNSPDKVIVPHEDYLTASIGQTFKFGLHTTSCRPTIFAP